MSGDDIVSSALDRHTAAASSARELRLGNMQQHGGAANDPVADLQWRLKVSEDIRRKILAEYGGGEARLKRGTIRAPAMPVRERPARWPNAPLCSVEVTSR